MIWRKISNWTKSNKYKGNQTKNIQGNQNQIRWKSGQTEKNGWKTKIQEKWNLGSSGIGSSLKFTFFYNLIAWFSKISATHISIMIIISNEFLTGNSVKIKMNQSIDNVRERKSTTLWNQVFRNLRLQVKDFVDQDPTRWRPARPLTPISHSFPEAILPPPKSY